MVDKLISGIARLVVQTIRKLTTARYDVATIFVDGYSDLDFVYVQESISAEETIEKPEVPDGIFLVLVATLKKQAIL